MERRRAPTYETTTTGSIEFLERRPEQLKSRIPVLISPGWGENPRVFADVIDELVGLGRHVIALKFQGDNKSNPLSDLPAIEVNRGIAILDLLEEKRIEQVHGLGHSEGGISLTIAASLQPERFNSLVLFGSGGMIEQRFWLLAGRFSKKVVRDLLFYLFSRRTRRSVNEGAKYMFGHFVEGIRAAKAISQSDIRQILRALEGLVKRGAVAGVRDPVFPRKRLQASLQKGDVEGFLSVRGGHDTLHTDRRYVRAAEYLFTAFEKQH